ncbi:MAG: hypothetical protein WBG41_05560, partial [Acidimicrobiales bacterium]
MDASVTTDTPSEEAEPGPGRSVARSPAVENGHSPGPQASSGPEERDSPDLAIGAFTRRGPWTVDPASMPWRQPGPGRVGV